MLREKNSWKRTKSISRNFQTFSIKWKILSRIFFMTTINFVSLDFFQKLSVFPILDRFKQSSLTFFPILRALWTRGKFFCFNKKTFWISGKGDPSCRKVPTVRFSPPAAAITIDVKIQIAFFLDRWYFIQNIYVEQLIWYFSTQVAPEMTT